MFIDSHNYVPYLSVKNPEDKILVYVGIFSMLDQILELMVKEGNSFCFTSALAIFTGKYFVQSSHGKGTKAVIVFSDIFLDSKPVKKGSVIIIGKNVPPEQRKIPGKNMIFYSEEFLHIVDKTIESRIKYAEEVTKKIASEIEHCPQETFSTKNLIPLGHGSYAGVFTDSFSTLQYAIKISKPVDEKWEPTPYNSGEQVWGEVFLLKDVIKPMILRKICPNLPILMGFRMCVNDGVPNIMTVSELASGNLTNFLKELRADEKLLMNCLFQVMAGIHATQQHAQMLNFDVKKENILVYKINPGGYYEYKIMGKKYHIPNLGYIFVVNDFGLSRTMTPKFPMYKKKHKNSFRLGHRLAYVKDGQLIPINCKEISNKDGEPEPPLSIKWDDGTESSGGYFFMNRQDGRILPAEIIITQEMKEYFGQKNASVNCHTKKFFEHPEVLPPMEFYNDTQDAIRMFTGHKRTTQRGKHSNLNLNEDFIGKISEYVFSAENLEQKFLPKKASLCIAGNFIDEFFGKKYPIYSEPPLDGVLIEKYAVS